MNAHRSTESCRRPGQETPRQEEETQEDETNNEVEMEQSESEQPSNDNVITSFAQATVEIGIMDEDAMDPEGTRRSMPDSPDGKDLGKIKWGEFGSCPPLLETDATRDLEDLLSSTFKYQPHDRFSPVCS